MTLHSCAIAAAMGPPLHLFHLLKLISIYHGLCNIIYSLWQPYKAVKKRNIYIISREKSSKNK